MLEEIGYLTDRPEWQVRLQQMVARIEQYHEENPTADILIGGVLTENMTTTLAAGAYIHVVSASGLLNQRELLTQLAKRSMNGDAS